MLMPTLFDAGGEVVGVLIALLVIIIVIFAIVGMMEGVFFLSILMQRSMQSHIHMLQKASLAEQFIVEDLCGTYSTQPAWLLTATATATAIAMRCG